MTVTPASRKVESMASRRTQRGAKHEHRDARSGAPSTLSIDAHAAPHLGFEITRHRTILLLMLVALVFKSVIFAPINWWPFAFVCLVPWLIVIGATHRAPRVYFHSYLFGLAFFLINMSWLYHATGVGYAALAIYQAAYFPFVACVLRHVIRRRRWPLALTLPAVWTASELLRAVVMSGFPWFFLSHGVHRVLTLIQISDLAGAYGVSFVIAAVNGALVDAVFAWTAKRANATPRSALIRAGVGGAFAAVVLLSTIVYGMVQLRGNTIVPGPKIAVLQGDWLVSVTGEEADDNVKRATYFSMLEAAASANPDLFLLPETPWFSYLNAESRHLRPRFREDFAYFQEQAIENKSYVVTGTASLEQTPYDLLVTSRQYNSAMVFKPDGSEPDRYDKVHLVPFGEAVPFRFGRFRWLYLWLNSLMPFTGPEGQREYSLFAGKGFHTFTMMPKSQADRSYRFGIPICYEDVMPYVSREFVSGGSNVKRADLLLNISNDGWYKRGHQQPQHLAICVYRAVENRVGIARAVNTGVSGFIEPDGRIHDLVMGDSQHRWPNQAGYAVATVGIDSRYSFYSRYGDWFAWSCAAAWLVMFIDYWLLRVREEIHV